MRQNNIQSIEISDKFKDLPTIDELRLILRLCSNLPETTLNDMISRLPSIEKWEQRRYKIYKLVKD
jgi:hypothetical protein